MTQKVRRIVKISLCDTINLHFSFVTHIVTVTARDLDLSTAVEVSTMPSRRSRSRSLLRERSRSPERHAVLPYDASPISESDYFQKSNEFRIWLKDEKGKVCLPSLYSAT